MYTLVGVNLRSMVVAVRGSVGLTKAPHALRSLSTLTFGDYYGSSKTNTT